MQLVVREDKIRLSIKIKSYISIKHLRRESATRWKRVIRRKSVIDQIAVETLCNNYKSVRELLEHFSWIRKLLGEVDVFTRNHLLWWWWWELLKGRWISGHLSDNSVALPASVSPVPPSVSSWVSKSDDDRDNVSLVASALCRTVASVWWWCQ